MSLFAVSNLAIANECVVDCPSYVCDTSCCNDGCGDWYVNIDALIWEASEGGLSLGNVSQATQVDTITTEVNRKSLHIGNKWNGGVRVGVAYRFPCECWDVGVNWTHFDTRRSKSAGPFATNQDFNPNWGSFEVIPGPLATVDAHWKLYLNWVDIEIGRNVCFNPCFGVRFHGGVRVLSANQRVGLFITNGVSATPSTESIHSKSDFNGAGLFAAIDSSWDVGCGFNLFVSGGGALIYGNQKRHFEETDNSFFEETEVNISHYKINKHLTRAMADFRLGLGYKYCFCDNMVLDLQVAWEQHMLFNQNHFIRTSFSGLEHHGDLSVQGVTLRAGLAF